MTALMFALTALCLAGAVFVAVLVAVNRLPGNETIALLAAVGLGTFAVTVLGFARLPEARGGLSVVTYVGYLIGIVLVVPAAARLAWIEQGRIRGGVLILALLLVPVLLLRIQDLWHG